MPHINPHILALPQECLIKVMTSAEPRDVISLRKTCGLFEGLTKSRCVWEGLIERIMEEQFIAYQIYPWRTMALRALEHAALLPRKFADLVKAVGLTNSTLEPCMSCRLSNRLTPNEQTLYGVSADGLPDNLCAALGGRYLVIKACHQLKNPNQARKEATVITLWDLGVSQAQPKVVTRMVILESHDAGTGGWQLHGLFFDPRAAYRGTLYLVCSACKKEKIYLQVYIVQIHSSTPEFNIHSKITLPDSTDHIAVSMQLYTLSIHYVHSNKRAFMVWRFIENKWANWVAQDGLLDADENVDVFSFKDSFVAMTRDNDLAIYNLPTFSQGNCPPAPLPIMASLTAKNTRLLNSHTNTDIAPYSEARPYFCMYKNKKVIIQKGVKTHGLNGIMAPKLLPVVCGSIDLPHLHSGLKIDFLDNTAKNHLMLGSMDREWRKCHLTVIDLDIDGNPVGTGEDIKAKTTKLGLIENVAISIVEFCSLRGRVFVITDNATPQVHVLDYILPSD